MSDMLRTGPVPGGCPVAAVPQRTCGGAVGRRRGACSRAVSSGRGRGPVAGAGTVGVELAAALPPSRCPREALDRRLSAQNRSQQVKRWEVLCGIYLASGDFFR